ncbi:MAG TPA: alpha-L-fucosidase [Chitinophagaceae bacterium]|nr:alpha-L-fucosidase [Chitinophagaceae bacterium]
MKGSLIILFLFCLCRQVYSQRPTSIPPSPYGVTPTANQLRWQNMEYYMFAHFGPNTFTGKEWGSGRENPDVFHPDHLDCRQWARIAKAAGMKGIILVAKHHDGFCLWPSRFSTHTVAYSSWRRGHGDVLKELSKACMEYGLKFGLYLSPWDRNNPAYGTPAYNQVFAGMLREVLTHYGPVFEVWFDGANGEGPNGKKQVYDWGLFDSTVKKYQPQAVIFNFSNRDGIRWVGNEHGYSTQTAWCRDNGFKADSAETGRQMARGLENGKYWRPSESDVSIRPGWFYHPGQDSLLKSVRELMAIYEGSVGRNSSLLLNVPPDQDGRISPVDSARLIQFRIARDQAFAHNLAQNARITASNIRGNDPKYSPGLLADGNPATYWTTDNQVHKAWVVLDFGHLIRFNTLVLMEYLPLGQRIRSFSVETWNGKTYQLLDLETTIGHKRILTSSEQTTSKIRIRILEASANPVLSEIGVYEDPAMK